MFCSIYSSISDNLFYRHLGLFVSRKDITLATSNWRLFATFGVVQLPPLKDRTPQDVVQRWKQSQTVQAAHGLLYEKINPTEASSKTYMKAIVESSFTDEEITEANSLFAQAVCEAVFDPEHLSTNIDANIIEKWYKKLNSLSSSSEVSCFRIY